MPAPHGNGSVLQITDDAQQALNNAYALLGKSYSPDHCLQFVRSCWGAAGMGGDPNHNIKFVPPDQMHSDMVPPLGAPVWFTGGSGTQGHIAIVSKYVDGKPYVITTDYPTRGKIGEVPLTDVVHWLGNLTYRGWSTNINNKQILRGTTHPVGDGGVPVAGQQTNSTSTTTVGTNPGSLGYTPAKATDVWDDIQSEFGLTANLLNLDKTDPKKGYTLREAFDDIRKQGITDPIKAANILARTNWFKQNGPDVTKRLAAEANGLGSFKENIAAKQATLKDQLAAAGISLGAKDLAKLSRDAYVYGLNDQQIQDKATSIKGMKFTGGGTIGSTMQYLDGLAHQNGVDISPADKQAWQIQIANGDKTQQDYEAMLRDRAATQYSVFGDQIHAGQNLKDLTAPYRDVASKLLEVAPDSIDWNDPLFKDGKAFQTVDPKTGQMSQKPLWQFRQEVMKDPRWQRTDNAKDTYTQFGADVLKRFGVMA
jgi:hypothetical protein